MKRIGVDVGGTFTDLIYVDDVKGTVLVHKTPSTPADPSIATVDGIKVLCQKAGIKPAELDQVFHGTTVATNIVIEHNGANVGMITTRGYRDIIHIARHKKPMNFSLWQNLPWQAYPIARRRNRLTVNERILADGSIQIPLDEREVRAQVRKLKKANVDSVAVCLLFSFKNPKHEKMVAKIVREEFPQAYLSVSSEVIPQYREYERFSTVALNAFVGPKVSNYVKRFDSELRKMGVKTGIHLMTSAAGVATPEASIDKPVNLLMSGPIAGVVGGIAGYFAFAASSGLLPYVLMVSAASFIYIALADLVPVGIFLTNTMASRAHQRYTITTGKDDNQDTSVNDRPVGVIRNSSIGPKSLTFNFNISKAFFIGSASSRNGSTRSNINLFANVTNAFNRPNYASPSGVMTSPNFGKSTSAGDPREFEVGLRYQF